MDVPGAVRQIVGGGGDASSRLQAFNQMVSGLLQKGDVASLEQLVALMLADDAQCSLFARPVLTQVATNMEKLNNVQVKRLALSLLEALRGRVVSFEEEDAVIRGHLADVLQAEGEFTAAAKCLAQIHIESASRTRTPAEKAELYVRIAELYLEDDDPVSADTFCGRAAMVIHDVEDATLVLRHKVTYARVLDSKCKFLDAAYKYAELGQISAAHGVREEDILHLLTNASICAVLAPAGPQRARVLTTLCKDERITSTKHFEILKKVYFGRLIKAPEIKAFEESLQEHQKALTADGHTVLERAILQHNVLAASLLYKNMNLVELGKVLQVEPRRAEKTAATMICEKRLSGYIDQQKGILHFETDRWLENFDQQIQYATSRVNSVLEGIGQLA